MKVKDVREALGASGADLARVLGVSRTTVCRMDNERLGAEPQVTEALRRIAEIRLPLFERMRQLLAEVSITAPVRTQLGPDGSPTTVVLDEEGSALGFVRWPSKTAIPPGDGMLIITQRQEVNDDGDENGAE